MRLACAKRTPNTFAGEPNVRCCQRHFDFVFPHRFGAMQADNFKGNIMTKMLITIGCLILSILSAGASSGQITLYSVTRSVAAEVASIENSEIIGSVGEMFSDSRQGDITIVAEAESLGASSAASCRASWSSTSSSIVASGTMIIDNSLSAPGGQRYFHCWATLVGEFAITEASSYSFGGTASADAHVLFHIENFDSGESINLSVPLGTGDFQFSGPLLGPGAYQFSVGLDDLRSATDVFTSSEHMEFGVAIVADGSVATKLSSWGEVKALFR